jgi:hypothetical protein
MRDRFIISVGAAKCGAYPLCHKDKCACYDLQIWNCGCRVFTTNRRLQIQPCQRTHCPVFGNLTTRQNPVRVQMRLEKVR